MRSALAASSAPTPPPTCSPGERTADSASRILVVPPVADALEEPGDLVVRVPSTLAFGTAEHATTRACLRFLEQQVAAGQRIGDVGTGSAILAVATAVLGAGRVLAFEADPHACAAAAETLEVNGVTERVDLREGEVAPGALPPQGPFDGLVANLRTDVLGKLMPDFAQALAPQGWLVVSGVLTGEREKLLAVAGTVGLEPAGEEIEDGWWTGRLRRAANGRGTGQPEATRARK